ncbi:MAG: hypothetical protein WDO15_00345 [Bacteroidota bacterium]
MSKVLIELRVTLEGFSAPIISSSEIPTDAVDQIILVAPRLIEKTIKKTGKKTSIPGIIKKKLPSYRGKATFVAVVSTTYSSDKVKLDNTFLVKPLIYYGKQADSFFKKKSITIENNSTSEQRVTILVGRNL